MNRTPPKSLSEVIKEGVVLRSVVTKCRHKLFLAGTIAASNEGFAQIIVMALFDMDRVSLALKRVSERQAVRSPFRQQKDKKRRRPKITEVSMSEQWSTVKVHSNASLARCFYASKTVGFRKFVVFCGAGNISRTDENTLCTQTRQIKLGRS